VIKEHNTEKLSLIKLSFPYLGLGLGLETSNNINNNKAVGINFNKILKVDTFKINVSVSN
jgi:hypothetical protein